MRTMISTGFRLTAIASLGFWWVWLMAGAAWYYTIEQVSLWSSFTSGAGIALVVMVYGVFSAMISDSLH
ncbi:hypothetical protein [Endozoicomonas sp. SESOKO1]|uniref:hypothetical protein n=1 Tax=Endozoicomonas sp. SESOKO1 TaxID=2828742 RepID=UPI002147D769|nr:hypothetical protein [Endozoicomonas sp. SESOKO1]